MSKGNMLLGHARGKVGSLVFSRANGQQIVRARAEVVKNPQTDAQVIQRILLNTISQAYSRMAPITDHSFEGVKAGQDSMSYFMKSNLNAIRTRLANAGTLLTDNVHVTPIGQSFLSSNPYTIAKGSLPEVRSFTVANNGMAWTITTNTYAGVINQFGLQRGDQLTFCLVKIDNQSVVSFKYARIILDPRDENGEEVALATPLFGGGEVGHPNPKNETADFSFTSIGDAYLISAGNDTIAASIIVSRQKDDGSWLRSNATMVANPSEVLGVSVSAALEDFRAGGLDVVNPKYLNNAAKVANATTSAAPLGYTISVSSNDPGNSTVAGGGSVERGQSVTLTATAGSDATFVGWYEGATLLSSANPYTFTPSRSMTIVGKFNVSGGD